MADPETNKKPTIETDEDEMAASLADEYAREAEREGGNVNIGDDILAALAASESPEADDGSVDDIQQQVSTAVVATLQKDQRDYGLEAFKKRVGWLKEAILAGNRAEAEILYRGGKYEKNGLKFSLTSIEDDNIICYIFYELVQESLALEGDARRDKLRQARDIVLGDEAFIKIDPKWVRLEIIEAAQKVPFNINVLHSLQAVFPEFDFAVLTEQSTDQTITETPLEALYIYEGIEIDARTPISEVLAILQNLGVLALEVIQDIAADAEMIKQADGLTIGEPSVHFRDFVSAKMREILFENKTKSKRCDVQWAAYALYIFGSSEDQRLAKAFLEGKTIDKYRMTGGIDENDTTSDNKLTIGTIVFWENMGAERTKAALLGFGAIQPVTIIALPDKYAPILQMAETFIIARNGTGKGITLRAFALQQALEALKKIGSRKRISADRIPWWAVAVLYIFGDEQEHNLELVQQLPMFAAQFVNGFPQPRA